MADAMSNHEIEDVLASIRRLVSDDLRPAPARQAPAALRPVAQPVPDDGAEPRYRPQMAEPLPRIVEPAQSDAKLLLTPSLRVAEVQDSAPEVPAPDARAWSAAPQPAAQDYAPLPEVAQAPERDDTTVWLSGSDVARSDVPATDAAPVTAPSAVQDEDYPEYAAQSAPDDYQPRDDVYEAEADITPAADASVAQPDPSADWAEHAEADIRARLEAEVIHRYHDHDTGHDMGHDRGQDAAYAADGMSDTQEITFDEQVLRDLVRDIIREELAGNLGERLTRNVRKLVRAEIARALAVQEFG